VDMELCFSRDGLKWDRPVRGGFIKRGKGPDAPDSMGIYAPNTWLERQDGWLCLYTGTSQPHNAHLKESDTHVRICGARFPKERFVGLAASGTAGGFLTDPFFLSRKNITVDANIRGWLRADLCDAFGRKLPGFHLMDSIPVQGDSQNHILRWNKEDVNRHRYECLRVRFEFEEGEVYSVSF